MPAQNDLCYSKILACSKLSACVLMAGALFTAATAVAEAQSPLRERLSGLPFKIAYETYVNDNWEIFVMNADGSNPVNLTQTQTEHEHYPQVSPDGTKICFSRIRAKADAVRSLYVMNVDARTGRSWWTMHAKPFWSPDGKVIGFLPQEYPKFNVMDYYTQRDELLRFGFGPHQPHQNSTNLFHLYNPSFARMGNGSFPRCMPAWVLTMRSLPSRCMALILSI